jgi:fibronectin-binding autotransporter adhesin
MINPLPSVARHASPTRKQPRRSASRASYFKRLALVAIFGGSLSVPALVSANDTTWNITTSGNWNTAGNWTAGVPADANTTIVRFAGSTSYTATQNIVNNILVNQFHVTNTGVGETVTIAGSAANRGIQLAGTNPVFNYSAASNVIFDANANVRFNADPTLSGNGTGVLTFANLGASGAADRTFTVNLSNPAASVNVTTLNINNNASVRTLTLATTSNITVGSIANGGATTGNFIKANGGTLTITGAGTYNGSTTLNNGTVAISGFNAFGTATTPIQLGNAASANVATISYTGTTASYTRGFNLGQGGGRLDVTNAATDLSIDTGAITGASANSTLTKGGAGTLTLNTANSYGGTTTILEGTLVQGNATAFGSSKVFSITSGGLLNVTNSGLSIGSAGSLTAGRASGFANDIQGNVALTSATLNVAGSATYGTLTQTGNLSLTGGTLQLNLNNVTTAGAGVNDLIDITGDLSLAGTIAVNVTALNGSLASGSYRLFSYTGSLTGGAGNFAAPNVAAPGRNTYVYDTSIANQVNLNVTAGAPGNLIWAGGTNANTWDLQNTINWTGEVDNKFYTGDTVNFTDAGLTNNSVNIDGALQPFAVNVSNTSGNYIFTSATSGSLAGTAVVTKTGAGSLTIQTANTYSGATNVNEGTLIVANAAALGSSTGATIVATGAQVQFTGGSAVAEPFTINGTGIGGAGALQNTSGATTVAGLVTLASASTIVNNDTSNTLTFDVASGNAFNGGFALTLAGAGNFAINDPIATGATGAVIKNGPGTLTLAGTAANGATGGYTLNGGTLLLNKTAGVDAIRGSLTIGNGTDPVSVQLLAANQIEDGVAVTVNAGATFDLNGNADSIGNLAGTGTVTSIGVPVFSVASGSFAGLLQGAGVSLTKTGTGLLTLANTANTFGGTLRVNNGTLEVLSLADSGAGSNGTGAIQILSGNNTGAILKYSGGTTTITRALDIVATGNAAASTGLDSSGTGPLTVTGNVSRSGTGGTGVKTFTLQGTNTGLNTISGAISNGSLPLSFAKEGPGTWRLTGTNTYTGTTTVSAGRLVIDGDNSTATGAVSVAAGATLSGSGTVGGLVTLDSGAKVAPGNSPGNQTFAGGLNLSAGGIYQWELGALSTSNPAVDFDTITVTGGSLTLGGTSSLLIDTTALVGTGPNSGNGFWTTPHTWTIATSASIVDNFGSITGGPWTSGTFDTSVSGNNLLLNFTPTAIPEPSTLVLGALGLLGFGGWSLRRRRRAINSVNHASSLTG